MNKKKYDPTKDVKVRILSNDAFPVNWDKKILKDNLDDEKS